MAIFKIVFCLTFVSDHNTDSLMLYSVQLKSMYSYLNSPGLPLGGRTPYITSKNRLRTPKLHIEDVPRTSENSLVRPKMDIETSCLQKKTRPHLPDYVIYVPPSYWKLIYSLGRPT